ncbi:hypothetical protein [Vibrio anguillarum]|uniref:hypothetical protein n=1 Tax=Vibrio anguillarum TaxID=55601 RepID=UPI00188C5480|nr:hypothetical protein [Vibrio anguillarum]MBF4446185.1 hypothetical protein [Vibrio anguillarum]
MWISLAICLRISASQLFLSQFFAISSRGENQGSWVASLENGAGWLKVSLAQRRFRFINWLNKTVVLG